MITSGHCPCSASYCASPLLNSRRASTQKLSEQWACCVGTQDSHEAIAELCAAVLVHREICTCQVCFYFNPQVWPPLCLHAHFMKCACRQSVAEHTRAVCNAGAQGL